MNTFSLLRLPLIPLKHVLRNMELPELIGFYLISRLGKALVKSLKLKNPDFQLACYGYYRIPVEHLGKKYDFRFDPPDMNPSLKPEYLKVQLGGAYSCGHTSMFLNPGFKLNDWVKHLLNIYHLTQIPSLQVNLYFKEAEKVKENLKELTWRQLDVGNLCHTSSDVLDYLIPTEQVICEVYNDSKNVLKANLEVLRFSVSDHLKINDLLFLNSRYAYFKKSNLTGNDFNAFINHWMSGVQSRLKYILIHSNNRVVTQGSVMDRVNYTRMDEQRTVMRCYDVFKEPELEVIEGGFDVQRDDGEKATILMKNCRNGFWFKMIIW